MTTWLPNHVLQSDAHLPRCARSTTRTAWTAMLNRPVLSEAVRTLPHVRRPVADVGTTNLASRLDTLALVCRWGAFPSSRCSISCRLRPAQVAESRRSDGTFRARDPDRYRAGRTVYFASGSKKAARAVARGMNMRRGQS